MSLSQRVSGVWNALSLEAPAQDTCRDNIQSQGMCPHCWRPFVCPAWKALWEYLELLCQKVDFEEVLVTFCAGRKMASIFLPGLLELGCGVSPCHCCGASVHPPGMEPFESCLFPFPFPYQLFWRLPQCRVCFQSSVQAQQLPSLSMGSALLPTPQLAAHLPCEALSWLPLAALTVLCPWWPLPLLAPTAAPHVCQSSELCVLRTGLQRGQMVTLGDAALVLHEPLGVCSVLRFPRISPVVPGQ